MIASSVSLLLAAAAPLTSALVVPSTPNVHHLQIRGPSGKYEGLSPAVAFLTSLNHTLAKYNLEQHIVAIPQLDKRAVNEALTDDGQDTEYSGNIKINSQTFSVDFDTGSSNLWVPAEGCTGCATNERYNMKGTDLKKTIQLKYGSGSVKGTEYSDTVSLGSLSATGVDLLAVKTAKGFKKSATAGLMGLAFQSLAAGGVNTFIGKLISENKLTTPEFSFFLGRKSSGTGAQSQLTLGGADSSLYSGSFTKVPVTKQGYWQVAVDGLYHDGKAVSGTSGQGAIDTGTTIIVTALDEVKALASATTGGKLANIGAGEYAYAFPCSQGSTTVGLGFGGKQFGINHADLVIGEASAGAETTKELLDLIEGPHNKEEVDDIREAMKATEYCVAAIAGIQGLGKETGGLSYIVGDTFLKNWYTTFSHANPPSVSFAVAKLNQ